MWDFGVGAGFYLNATQPKWKNWRMYDYITKELPGVLKTLQGLDVDNVSPLPQGENPPNRSLAQ